MAVGHLFATLVHCTGCSPNAFGGSRRSAVPPPHVCLMTTEPASRNGVEPILALSSLAAQLGVSAQTFYDLRSQGAAARLHRHRPLPRRGRTVAPGHGLRVVPVRRPGAAERAAAGSERVRQPRAAVPQQLIPGTRHTLAGGFGTAGRRGGHERQLPRGPAPARDAHLRTLHARGNHDRPGRMVPQLRGRGVLLARNTPVPCSTRSSASRCATTRSGRTTPKRTTPCVASACRPSPPPLYVPAWRSRIRIRSARSSPTARAARSAPATCAAPPARSWRRRALRVKGSPRAGTGAPGRPPSPAAPAPTPPRPSSAAAPPPSPKATTSNPTAPSTTTPPRGWSAPCAR